MPDFSAIISDFSGGDKFEVRATFTNLDVGVTVVQAWMSVRLADDPNSGLVWGKHVTSTNVSGVGQITDPGSGTPPNRTATARFDVMPADSLQLIPKYPQAPLYFDIRGLLSSGANDIVTAVKGIIYGEAPITTGIP